MEIEIDEATLAKAKYCKKAFACLDHPRDICYPVTRVHLDQVYYVRYMHDYYCQYEDPIGEYSSCSCPVRKEIYRRYDM